VSQEWNCAFKQPETLDTALDSFHRVTHRPEAKLQEESISCPTQTDYAIQTPSTMDQGQSRPLRETQVRRTQSVSHLGDSKTFIKTQVPLLTNIQQGLYPRVQPIISIKPILSWRSKHRPEHSFNKFNIAT